ncbi:hypothetical protein P6U16_01335 [Rhizobium sp. 32-5/1]|uniref:hypothetical protein n=1 Tax=Rhizobium sp. 32-5/1 TaxID=3019602 RepID=UPI00240DB76D|nr:hypothetical protein [Rhizobium sp. 32-5/1]WEZ83529.1 hypothetical protein P6U16_01335 [Rhizobium sp. 32-5/1]
MKTTSKNPPSERPPSANEPVPAERCALTEADKEIMRPLTDSLKMPMFKKSPTSVIPDHVSPALGQAMIAKALGITDGTLYAGAIEQLINVSSKGLEIDIDALNFAVSLVRGIEPRDHLETMLAMQMAAVHMASMTFARKMNHTETIPQLDLQERVVNKLMRTFTTQMEALRKHRNGGSQKVIVKHVHVYEGGQAIVGSVSHGGGPSPKEQRNPMNKKIYPFQSAPRCTATSKRTKNRCQAPAERLKTVCRFHGARAGAPRGEKTVLSSMAGIPAKWWRFGGFWLTLKSTHATPFPMTRLERGR